jgi:hypothetical protein
MPDEDRGNQRSLVDFLTDTLTLRSFLIETLQDLVKGRITNAQSNARSRVAREITETVKIEIIAARQGMVSYKPVKFFPPEREIEGVLDETPPEPEPPADRPKQVPRQKPN